MRETRNREFKEKVSNSFLKTVSAFANYGGGVIQFGIKDDGEQVGIDNPKQVCLNIENKINDSIKPSVDYTLDIDQETGFGKTKTVAILNKLINEGYVIAVGNGRGKKYASQM